MPLYFSTCEPSSCLENLSFMAKTIRYPCMAISSGFISIQCSVVSGLRDAMDCNAMRPPVHHQLWKLLSNTMSIRVWCCQDISSCHPFSSCLGTLQHQRSFQWVISSGSKLWSLSSASVAHWIFGLTSGSTAGLISLQSEDSVFSSNILKDLALSFHYGQLTITTREGHGFWQMDLCQQVMIYPTLAYVSDDHSFSFQHSSWLQSPSALFRPREQSLSLFLFAMACGTVPWLPIFESLVQAISLSLFTFIRRLFEFFFALP